MAVATRWPLVGRGEELDSFAETLQDPGRQAFCIYGRSGVGKTRLADECLAVADAAGRRVLRATAEHSDSAVPLAAVAHLLPTGTLTSWQEGEDGGSVVRARVLDAALRVLAPASGESGRPVLLLDDAHRVDRSSLAVVDHLLAHGGVFGVATVNNEGPVPETVTQWWREERATRIDLRELDPVGVDTLIHVVLEGPLDGGASAELWRASQGNVLILHELVRGALADESLVCRDGVWRLDGPLGTPASLGDLVERRIDRLAPTGRSVLELLAFCQPVALDQLESDFGLDVLENLEREGLIAVRTDGRRQAVSLAHPLHGELVRARVPRARARSILLDHAEALQRYGARRRDDAVRIAMLRLEATGQADPDLLLRAARVARNDHDFATVARLAQASLVASDTALGGLVLGEALYNLGSFEQADEALAAAAETAADDLGAAIAAVRCRNLFAGCRREGDAAAVVRQFLAGPVSDSGRAELLVGEAEMLVGAGRPLDALALLEGIDVSDRRRDVLAAIPRTAALAMTGRTADALAESRQAYRDHVGLDDPLATPTPGTHRVNELFALVQAGHLLAAAEFGRAWLEGALQAHLPLEVTWLAVHLARGALVQGRPMTALSWADRASQTIEAHRFAGLGPAAAAIRAAAHGLLGDVPASTAAADEADRLSSGFGALAGELPLGRAWALVAAGDLRSARKLLVGAADGAATAGFVPSAAWLLHDAVRIGAGDLEGRLAVLAATTDSALVHLRADHVAALAAGDGDRLEATARQFEEIGAVLLAAEATAQAADASRQHGDERRGAALDARRAALAARCETARTPVLVRAGTVVTLSGRERDVAVLAAGGLSSRAIAAELLLSVRTVDNHLGRVYAKLGVSSRAELVTALQLDRHEDGPA
jgi:DNA-binding CsgD family transcriptional regulator/tetratricopeptide (TPR) repeat protein